jgi:hypothetical protein
MHHGYYDAVFHVTAVISTALDDMENTFARIPEPQSNMWNC